MPVPSTFQEILLLVNHRHLQPLALDAHSLLRVYQTLICKRFLRRRTLQCAQAGEVIVNVALS